MADWWTPKVDGEVIFAAHINLLAEHIDDVYSIAGNASDTAAEAMEYINSIEEDLERYDLRILKNQGDITNITQRLNTLEGQSVGSNEVKELTERLNSLTTTVSTNTTDIAQNKKDISQIQQNVSTAQSDISVLKSAVSNLADNTALQEINNRIDDLETEVNNLSGGVDLTELSNKFAELEELVRGLAGDFEYDDTVLNWD